MVVWHAGRGGANGHGGGVAGGSLAQATGAFIVCALLMTAARRHWLVRARDGPASPCSIASALLAGDVRFADDAPSPRAMALPLVLLMLGPIVVGACGQLWVPGIAGHGTAFAAARWAAAPERRGLHADPRRWW